MALLSEHPGARPLAGGQSMVNVLKLRAAEVDALVDISELDEIRFVELLPDGGLEIGAGVRYAELARHPLVLEHQPKVAQVADGTVDVQVRNRGTLGGNLGFNDPTSNFPPLIVALGATVKIAGPAAARGSRRRAVRRAVPARARPRRVHPLRRPAAAGRRCRRRLPDAAARPRLVGAGPRRRPHRAQRVGRATRASSSPASPGVPRASRASRPPWSAAAGDAAAVDAALAEPLENVAAVSDSHATAEYRLEMARVYARRAVEEALGSLEDRA